MNQYVSKKQCIIITILQCLLKIKNTIIKKITEESTRYIIVSCLLIRKNYLGIYLLLIDIT